MKISILCFLACVCLWAEVRSQEKVAVYPVPREISLKGGQLQLPALYRLTGGETADAVAVAELKALLGNEPQQQGKFAVYIGKRGDWAVKKFVRQIPRNPEGYYLSVEEQRIVLAGNDERGVYYAVKTLSQLLDGNRLPLIEIRDYPAVRYRGVVEGFYGTPWSHEARLSQLKFYGENKMNTYIYGPKDDPYHSCPNWRKPYPETEAAQIRQLAEAAARNKVDFVWAIHPGQDIRWNQEDRDLLLGKFENMYRLGVRSFAVFFDDISGEGTDPQRQAELLNYIDDRFVKVKKDVTPLIMCPTEYNKSWSDPAKGYLATLGSMLNPSIQIMWTGDRVISDITEEGMKWINGKIGRPAYIWWNFPVSDYVRDHLLMGPVYGLDRHIGHEMSGFVTNPMEHAEASKIAVFSVADYAWNPEKFDSRESWRAAMRALLPENADMLEVFARHNSDTGPNGHGYRRDESVEMQPVAGRFLKAYREGHIPQEEYAVLADEFARIEEAADVLSVDPENRPLIREIQPWLEQFKTLGSGGTEVLSLLRAAEAGDKEMFMRKYRHMKALQEKSYRIDQTYNQNPYQPGIKTGSKVMQPLVDTLFVWAVQRYNQRAGSELSCAVFTSPHRSYSTVAQCKTLPVRVKTNRLMMSPLLEVVKWGAGQYVGMELDKVCFLKGLEADFGVKEGIKGLWLEVSVDGTNWSSVPLEQNKNQIKASIQQKARFVRLMNEGDAEQEVYLRKFMITQGDR